MSNLENNNPLSEYSFPHLEDTSFPLLENVDVYEYENEFDYKRWTDNTKIYLCNVLWNNDYSNVVKFDNDVARDSYFDGLEKYTVELETGFHVAPDNTVKVPLPYQVATRYNYLYVDLPTMTSDKEPIEYETTRRTKRFYYFIDSLVQNAPNSTMLIVSLDSWTTYINNVDIPYLMLERGHAPMSMVKVEDYLKFPIANNRYLLAPDYDFSDGNGIVKSGKFVPINSGEKYILLATTLNASQLKSIDYPKALDNTNTPATFVDRDGVRYGHLYDVKGYEWNIGNWDYSNSSVEVDSYQTQNNLIPNNMTIVACPAKTANILFETMSEQLPYFFKSIKACFMVDDSMFTKGESITLCNVTCYIANPAADSLLETLHLAKEDFEYDDKYADIAKLYTFPYAEIEVTDNDETTKSFRIENCGSVAVRQATSIAFPYISIQAYLTGVNGNSVQSYQWKQLDGATLRKQMYFDDFGEYLWDWNIPTYSLYVSAYNDYKASNYPKQQLDRYNAVKEYNKTAGLDNTMYENSKDAANNTQTMTNNSAASEYNNALDMNNTINTNNIASANTAQANANASAATAKANNDRLALMNYDNYTQLEINLMEDIAIDNMQCQYSVLEASQELIEKNSGADVSLTSAMTSAENEYLQASGAANAVASAVSGVASGNFVGGAVGGILAGATSAFGVTKNEAQSGAVISNNVTKAVATEGNNSSVYKANLILQQSIVNETSTSRKAVRNETKSTHNTNAAETYSTEVANAARTNATSVANANRQKATSDGNALRTKNNTNTNAQLNRDVTVSNSGYTRDIGILNAQITLEQKRIANQQQYLTNKLAAPLQYGSTSGNATLDAYARRGLQFKVRTQADGYIAQAGDMMLRYGYSLNEVWNVNDSGLCLMKHYTYWKASDLWINEGEGVNQNAQRDIQRAFMQGVTVWNDPEKIGKVSIYDNWAD